MKIENSKLFIDNNRNSRFSTIISFRSLGGGIYNKDKQSDNRGFMKTIDHNVAIKL